MLLKLLKVIAAINIQIEKYESTLQDGKADEGEGDNVGPSCQMGYHNVAVFDADVQKAIYHKE